MNMWTIVVIGLGTVFLALAGLMAVLNLFRIFLAPKTPAPAAPAVAVAAERAPAPAGGNELVAAITAAICAYQGGAAKSGSFRIVEIIKSGVSTPAWSSQDRTRKNPRG